MVYAPDSLVLGILFFVTLTPGVTATPREFLT